MTHERVLICTIDDTSASAAFVAALLGMRERPRIGKRKSSAMTTPGMTIAPIISLEPGKYFSNWNRTSLPWS